MTQEEIKSRNIALAAYMGHRCIDTACDTWECQSSPGHVMTFSGPPPFDDDMNLLMPVMWKLMSSGFRLNQYIWDGSEYWAEVWDDHRPSKVCAMSVSPAHALWEAVSSLVMELQKPRAGEQNP